ncbi:MAG: transposase [Kofleriaceae bacterium]
MSGAEHLQAQLELTKLVRKPDKNGQWRGGARLNAGRPKHDGKAGRPKRKAELHLVRPKLRASQPVHVVMRANPAVGSLRRHDVYRAIRDAIIVSFLRETFRIVHFSIQRTHLHLIIEACDRTSLSRGMQGFGISAAKHINAAISERRGERRRGPVFTDRYHAVILNSPRQVRNTLNYVLNNWHHHGERRDALRMPWRIDPYSSALAFDGWKEREDRATAFRSPVAFNGPIVWLPRTWLLRVGWRRHGLISIDEVPGLGPE